MFACSTQNICKVVDKGLIKQQMLFKFYIIGLDVGTVKF